MQLSDRECTAELTELSSGFDALYLSGRAAVPGDLLDGLSRARTEAEARNPGSELELGGESFLVMPHGWGKYKFNLLHQFGQIGISPRTRLPAIRVQPRAEFLHGTGVIAAVDWFRRIVEIECGETQWSVSRMDLHADFQGWPLEGDDRHRFVCRADDRDTREVAEEFSGFEFGRRKTNTVMCRIYDKTRHIKVSGAGYWPEIWGSAYTEGDPVLRVEFEVGRKGLKQFSITTPEEAIALAPSLWKYCTHDWMSYRVPTGDSTKSRWPLAPEWVQIQSASLGVGGHGIERMYGGRRTGDHARVTLPRPAHWNSPPVNPLVT
jgi:hypothetical protein